MRIMSQLSDLELRRQNVRERRQMEVVQQGLQPGSHDRWQHIKSVTKQMALDFKRGEIAFSGMPRVGSQDDSEGSVLQELQL